jgi:glutamate dehydrogenase (NAD(P)+)
VVTGKPVNIGGSRGRREATGRGVMLVTREAIKKLGLKIPETRVIVQGFGNVGSYAALLLHELGCKVIGIGEWDGGIYNKNGLDITALFEHKAKTGSIHWFKGSDKMATEELLISDCDVLVPAATENVITTKNAAKIKAKIISEGANGPTTAKADDILQENGIFVIPDILANAGGVTTSYFEWVQDRQGYFWKEAFVNAELECIMVDSFNEVVRYAESHHVNNRIAAYMLAIDRVAYNIRQRGIYA